MTDNNSTQLTQSDDSFSQQDLTELFAGTFEGTASFQKAVTEAAEGNFQSATGTLAEEFNNQSAAFSKLAANAQAKGNLATAARFESWAQRTAAQAASFSATGAGTAESVYDGWIQDMGSRVQATEGAFSNPAIQGLAKSLGWVGAGASIYEGWIENGWTGAAKATAVAGAGWGAAELAALLFTALLPFEAPVLIVGLAVAVVGFAAQSLAKKALSGLGDDIEREAKEINSDGTYRIVRYDPLALDLNGDGIVSTQADGNWSGAMFDNDGDGIKTATGWIGASDGLLVRDIDGNGTIDSGRELFGDQTLLADGSRAADGFHALAAMDSNGDGKVDAADADFASIRVWRDANGNGTTDAGELLTLTELGITSLAVTPGSSSNVSGN